MDAAGDVEYHDVFIKAQTVTRADCEQALRSVSVKGPDDNHVDVGDLDRAGLQIVKRRQLKDSEQECKILWNNIPVNNFATCAIYIILEAANYHEECKYGVPMITNLARLLLRKNEK